MRRLWLTFAQAVTLAVAVLFVVQTLKPEWLAKSNTPLSQRSHVGIVALKEAVPPPSDAPRNVISYADAAKRAVPTVVHVFTSQEVRTSSHPLARDPFWSHFFGDQTTRTQRRSGLGSGVVVSEEGYILTNYHVVEAADEIEVASNDGRMFKAKIVGSDPESDLAVLRVPADAHLTAITFASADSLRVGDVVLAIGNPFGVGQTVTSGIVSALGRSHLGINTFENFIQTDAAINPGNSGGALVDSDGNLIGINTAIYSQNGGSMGIGFAIPISLARNVLEQIIKTGTVTRGWIGVEVQDISAELADSFGLPDKKGALIAGVVRGSPAERYGIRPGDVLLSIDGQAVKESESMLAMIASLSPNQTSQVSIRRDNKVMDIEIVIGKRPPAQRTR